MLRKISKACFGISCILTAVTVFLFFTAEPVLADNDDGYSTEFQVDVEEVLSVSVTSPTDYASGDPGVFLRNKITVSVSSNNTDGFVAGISATKVNNVAVTTLSNSSGTTIPTLTGDIICNSPDASANNGRCTNFTNDRWGYSLDDGASYNGTYKGVSSTIDKIFDSGTGTSRVPTKTKDIYIGARAAGVTRGTYTGSVSITVISGATSITTEPTDPAEPEDDDHVDDEYASYQSDAGTNGSTVYTTTQRDTENDLITEISQISDGDNTLIYPLGETHISGRRSNITLVFAIASVITATAGGVFFAFAKRDEDDDDNSNIF